MSSLKEVFENHKETIMAILKENSLVEDCIDEVETALSNLDNELQSYALDRVEEKQEEITGEEVIDFIEENPEICGAIAELLEDRGYYLIEAKNLNEQSRVEEFIEQLEKHPYAP